jgi:hypothetical protein
VARNPAAKTGRRDPARIATEQSDCLKLKLDGLSVRAIADRTGLPASTVQDRLTAAYAELVVPLAEESRQLELARLDRWQVKLEQRLTEEAAERIVPVLVKVSESRRRLLGVDAPERTEVSIPQLPADPAAAAILEAAKARAAERVAALKAGGQ